MFLLSLAFIIFTGVNITLQVLLFIFFNFIFFLTQKNNKQTRSVQDTSSLLLGGDVLLYASSSQV
jgi:preprotein translocase subunit YajC